MKTILSILFFDLLLVHTLAWGANTSTAFNFEMYSNGYTMGIIENVERIGTPRSTEVTVHVGGIGGVVTIHRHPEPQWPRANTPEEQAAVDNERFRWEQNNSLVVTPWHFSALTSQQPEIEKYQRRMTMTHFFERRVRDPFLETPREWIDTFDLRQANFNPMSWKVNTGSHNLNGYGSREGRIVQINYQGSTLVKTYEVIVQWGDRGRSFEAMSIRDWRLARYAILAMQSDAILRLHYTRSYARSDSLLQPAEAFWRLLREFALIRWEESGADIYKIEQEAMPNTRTNDMISIPVDVISNSNVDLDSYIKQFLMNGES